MPSLARPRLVATLSPFGAVRCRRRLAPRQPRLGVVAPPRQRLLLAPQVLAGQVASELPVGDLGPGAIEVPIAVVVEVQLAVVDVARL